MGHFFFAFSLRQLLASIELEGEEMTAAGLIAPPPPAEAPGSQAAQASEKKADVYSEASEELIAARRSIYNMSVSRASDRLSDVKRRKTNVEAQKSCDEETLKLYDSLRKLNVQASQVGDNRPLSCVKCSPGGGLIASGALSNAVKVWDMDQGLTQIGVLGGVEGHTERNTGLAWHPTAQLTSDSPILATSAADKTAKIWKLRLGDMEDNESGSADHSQRSGGDCVMTLKGHEQRLGMVAFHPSGEYVGTASYDRTWRLWHVETGKEVLLQVKTFRL
jgi:U4/U6 small nuclear ribonucleoprotein PRP4